MAAPRKRACDCADCRARDAREWDAIVGTPANVAFAKHLYRVGTGALTPEEIVERAAIGRAKVGWDGPA